MLQNSSYVVVVVGCTLFVVVVIIAGGLFPPATVLVMKLKCIPSYDGRMSEHWQYDIHYGQSLKINIAGESPSFVPTAKIKGDGLTVEVNRTLGGGAREVKPCLPRLGTPAG